MQLIQCSILLILAVFTLNVYSQTRLSPSSEQTLRSATGPSQDVVNAITEQRLASLERSEAVHMVTITNLSAEMSAMRSSMDRFTGIGIGLGVCLTVIQSLLVIMTFRNGKKRSE